MGCMARHPESVRLGVRFRPVDGNRNRLRKAFAACGFATDPHCGDHCGSLRSRGGRKPVVIDRRRQAAVCLGSVPQIVAKEGVDDLRSRAR